MSVWSPYPQESYTVKMPTGARVGPGAHKILTRSVGAWNLYWLSDPTMDALLGWTGPWDKAPVASTWAAKLAASLDVPLYGETLEQRCGRMSADLFYRSLSFSERSASHLSQLNRLPIYEYAGEAWVTTLGQRTNEARPYLSLDSVERDNIVVVDFSQSRKRLKGPNDHDR